MRVLIVCTTDSMIWNFLVPHIKLLEEQGNYIECACSKTGDYFENLKNKYNIVMNEIRFNRSPYKIANFKAYKELNKLIKNKKFDIIFCHEPVGGAIGRLSGHHCDCKVIYMAHGFHFFKGAPLKNWIIYYTVEKILSKITDVIITINYEDYKFAQDKFNAKKVYLVHGVGVDANKFNNKPIDTKTRICLKKELQIHEDDFCIFYVAELIKRKNQIVLIKAMKDIVSKNKKIKVFLVGDGELTDYYKNEIKKINLEKNVFMLGYRTDIPELFKIADLCVSTSLQEGLAINLVEAVLSGTPILVSNIRGHKEIVKEGINGYSFENENELIDKILKISSDKKMLEELSKKACDSVKEFKLENVYKEQCKIYKEEF